MRVEKDIVVSAPVARVYELWTDFENFPRFMHHVEEVSRTGANRLHWKAKLGPLTVEWDAEIKALVPNRTVTWHSTTGADNAGAVTLAEKGHITEMHVVIEYSPNLFEKLADIVTGEMQRSVEQDLERFRALAEGRDVDAESSDSSGVGSKIAATVAGVAGAVGIGGKDKEEDTPRMSRSSKTSSGSSRSTAGSSSGSSSAAGAASDLQRSTAVQGVNIGPARDETAGSTTPSAVEAQADDPRGTVGVGSDLDTPPRRSNVEIEGLGSDESPGEAVGSTSPEEIAAAREALGGTTPDSGSGSSAGMPGGAASSTAAGSNDTGSGVPSAGEMGLNAGGARPGDTQGRTGTDFMGAAAAAQTTMQDSAVGAPGNPGDQEGGLLGVTPTRGGVDGSSPDAPATEVSPPTTGGAMGPSLMTYEAGTGPDTSLTGSSDLGSMADDRTSLGSTTVSTGSMTDTGRARDTGGMAGGEAGFTTASTSSMAGSGDLGGGPDDVGGRANIPDLGHTPSGGGTGRGAGDAYGSQITQSGGPHSAGLPFDSTASGENTMGGNTMLGGMDRGGADDRGDMVIATGNSPRDLGSSDDTATDRGDMVIATGNAARDLGSAGDSGSTDRGDMVIATGNSPRDLGTDDTEPSPVEDATVGGTGAGYSGGTGGWGTETPDSSGVAGWSPSSTDTRTSGGETH